MEIHNGTMNNSAFAHSHDEARAAKLPAPVGQHLFPPDVKTVGVVSISYLMPAADFVSATDAVRASGVSLKIAPNVTAEKVLPPQERSRLFEEAYLDPEIDLLWFSRGGKGAEDVVPLLDWNKLRSRPDMRVVGFSDLTILLNAMLAKGAGHPLSGPSLAQTLYWNESSRDWFSAALRGEPLPEVHVEVLRDTGKGAVPGKPMGGHLDRLIQLRRLGLFPSAVGRVVFFECTAGYPPADLIRGLEEMRDDGALDGAAAVVFCDFRHVDDEKAALEDFFPAFAATLPCPVFAGFPYGHIPNSRLLDFRRTVEISADGVVHWETVE